MPTSRSRSTRGIRRTFRSCMSRIASLWLSAGESARVFALWNWTELDVWMYIQRASSPVVALYFAAERPIVERNGRLLLVDDSRFSLAEGETPTSRRVRFRTLGCYPLTGAVESRADSPTSIIDELLASGRSERNERLIDGERAGSMEHKKREGYF